MAGQERTIAELAGGVGFAGTLMARRRRGNNRCPSTRTATAPALPRRVSKVATTVRFPRKPIAVCGRRLRIRAEIRRGLQKGPGPVSRRGRTVTLQASRCPGRGGGIWWASMGKPRLHAGDARKSQGSPPGRRNTMCREIAQSHVRVVTGGNRGVDAVGLRFGGRLPPLSMATDMRFCETDHVIERTLTVIDLHPADGIPDRTWHDATPLERLAAVEAIRRATFSLQGIRVRPMDRVLEVAHAPWHETRRRRSRARRATRGRR